MNKFISQNMLKTACLGTIITFLTACSSGDSSNLTSGRGGSANSLLNLDITDAAIDDADEVWVEFTGVSIQPSSDQTDQSTIEFTFDTAKRINLLGLQGNKVQALLIDEIIPSGSYDWIRLAVNAERDSTLDSYIKLKDGSTHEIFIPSGSQTGLKLNTGFELIAAAEFNFTIDFDLRKSVVMTGLNQYQLRPTLRLINNAVSATISGDVNASLLSTTGDGCTDNDPLTGNAVYLFSNSDVIPDDIDNQPENPFSTALVTLNGNTGKYEYTLGFIPQGNYTISFTCQAENDNPVTSDSINFTGTTNISLIPGQVLTFNF